MGDGLLSVARSFIQIRRDGAGQEFTSSALDSSRVYSVTLGGTPRRAPCVSPATERKDILFPTNAAGRAIR